MSDATQTAMARHDVIVVGAGFSGLSAATELMRAGCDVLLLEARHRVGGRVESTALADGARIDSGGQFLCRDMVELNALTAAHGRPITMSYVDGDEIYQPPIPQSRGHEIWAGVEALRDQIIHLDLTDPALAGLTVTGWLSRQPDLDRDVAAAYCRLIEGLWCCAPSEISFVWLAGADARITNEYPEGEAYLGGTMHALADDIAAELGDRLRLSSPVDRIAYSTASATVHAGSQSFRARRVIVCVPPVMASRITYDPPPPASARQAFAAWKPGDVIKVFIRYETPFWRPRGLSGMVLWAAPHGLYACDAAPDGLSGLVMFIGGPYARQWHGRPQSELGTFIRERLVEALGEEAGNIVEISIRDWTDDIWSGGAYADNVVGPDAGDAEAPLRTGFGPIRFASSELSPSYPGYIEGAITMGRIAAREAVSALKDAG